MDNKKRNIIILISLCVLLVVIGIFIFIDIFSKDDYNNLIINNQDDIVISNNNMNDSYNNDTIDKEENNTIDRDNHYSDDKVDNTNDLNIENNNIKNEYNQEDVIGYFESMEYEIDNSKSFNEKFKDYFITIIDFIFYSGDIKGYTFSELTGTTKAKIIAVALKIDTKIDEYFPGYKESISSTTGKVYTNIKEKLVTLYMDVSTSICEDNKDECDKVKEIFSDIKDYCKIGWDFIKGLFKSGFTKVKDWYEIYSGK